MLAVFRPLTLVPLAGRSCRELSGFCGPRFLTLAGELPRSQVPEGAVGPLLAVIVAPRFDAGLSVGPVGELVHVQALVAQLADSDSM